MIKRLLTLIVLLLIGTGCVRAAPENNTSDEDLTAAPTTIFSQPSSTPVSDNEGGTDEASPTEDSQDNGGNDSLTETPFLVTPTLSAQMTASPIFTNTPSSPATAAPTRVPTQVPSPSFPPLNPDEAYKGSRRFVETFETDENWITSTGFPPDTENIRMAVEGGIMQVTGKYQTFHTWWYSNKRVGNGYIEMDVNSGNCAGDDSYGFIVRGALSGESARGYIIGFTCDGNFFVNRLDSDQGYPTQSIFIATPGDTIKRGKNKINTIGIEMDEENFVIFANGYEVGRFIDTTHIYGRYGLFVSAGPTANYTYEILEIRIWDWTVID